MELDDYLDTDWIGEVREEERAFDRYYVAPMRYINVFFMRVDGGRVGKRDDITGYDRVTLTLGEPNVVRWSDMLPLMGTYFKEGYVLRARQKYGMTATPEQVIGAGGEGTGLGGRLIEIASSEDVYFGDTVEFMHDVSCIVCVMYRARARDRDRDTGGQNNKTTRVIRYGGGNKSSTRKRR
jgi:hypothetical protein